MGPHDGDQDNLPPEDDDLENADGGDEEGEVVELVDPDDDDADEGDMATLLSEDIEHDDDDDDVI